jgi:hypothetical protein
LSSAGHSRQGVEVKVAGGDGSQGKVQRGVRLAAGGGRAEGLQQLPRGRDLGGEAGGVVLGDVRQDVEKGVVLGLSRQATKGG